VIAVKPDYVKTVINDDAMNATVLIDRNTKLPRFVGFELLVEVCESIRPLCSIPIYSVVSESLVAGPSELRDLPARKVLKSLHQ